jgi:hypothetical protein
MRPLIPLEKANGPFGGDSHQKSRLQNCGRGPQTVYPYPGEIFFELYKISRKK